MRRAPWDRRARSAARSSSDPCLPSARSNSRSAFAAAIVAANVPWVIATAADRSWGTLWIVFIGGPATSAILLVLSLSCTPLVRRFTGGGVALHVAVSEPPGSCRPEISVPDLDAFHKSMLEKKIPCVEQPRVVFGVKLAQYADPDGLAISVSEERRGK